MGPPRSSLGGSAKRELATACASSVAFCRHTCLSSSLRPAANPKFRQDVYNLAVKVSTACNSKFLDSEHSLLPIAASKRIILQSVAVGVEQEGRVEGAAAGGGRSSAAVRSPAAAGGGRGRRRRGGRGLGLEIWVSRWAVGFMPEQPSRLGRRRR